MNNEHAQQQKKRKEVKRFCGIVAASRSAAWLVPDRSFKVDAGIDYTGVVELGDAETEALHHSC